MGTAGEIEAMRAVTEKRSPQPALTNVLQARAGFRLCCMLKTLGPPCLSTSVRPRFVR